MLTEDELDRIVNARLDGQKIDIGKKGDTIENLPRLSEGERERTDH